VIRKFKILLLGSIPSILPKNLLIWYWLTLSNFQRFFRKSDYIHSIHRYQAGNLTNLFLLKMSDGELLIQDLMRASRFLRGQKYATTRLYNQYVRESSKFHNLISNKLDQFVIFDIGANIGEFSIAAAARFQNSLIYAFEPDPTAYECLKFNINTLNLSSTIKLVDEALSNLSGLYSFYISTANADSSLIEPTSYSTIIKHNCIRGDKFMQKEDIKKISLFKMDVEGFEPEVLEGFGDQLNNIDFFTIDVGPERAGVDTEFEVTHILESKGAKPELFKDIGTRKFINAYRENL
jgi:FkbM family methyltransferase